MAANYITKPALRTPESRQHVGNDGKCMVATTLQRNGRNCANLPTVQNSGKNNEPLLRHPQKGKLPECKEIKQELAIDFAGPFQNAKGARKNILVSIDLYSGWPETKFLRKPNTEKVIVF